MRKLLFVILFTIISSCLFAATATVTQTVTQTVTPTVTGGKAAPTPTVTITPYLTKAEITVWRDKLNPVKPLKNVKAFTNIIGKTELTDAEIIEYVQIKVPVAEVVAVKTVISKYTSTPTKTVTKTVITEIKTK
ncbi:MAG: hypothetical protein PHQ63_06395 [Smithellaceae bacterium]|nr:hypothetical protein [Smithellaceae bacterium]